MSFGDNIMTILNLESSCAKLDLVRFSSKLCPPSRLVRKPYRRTMDERRAIIAVYERASLIVLAAVLYGPRAHLHVCYVMGACITASGCK